MISRTRSQIRNCLDEWSPHRGRTIIVIDYSNVRRWQDTFGRGVSIPDLGRMADVFCDSPKLRRRLLPRPKLGTPKTSWTPPGRAASRLLPSG